MMENIVTKGLKILTTLVPEPVNAPIEANNELKTLENEVRLIKGFLRDVDENQLERSRKLDLERQMKELVYNVQDIRELWSPLEAKFSPLVNVDRAYKQKKELESIRDDRVEPMFRIIEAKADLKLKDLQHPTKFNQAPWVQLNIEVSITTVGFEDVTKTLISSLLQKNEELDVVSVTGMPGIGKTTLAWKLYQHETIRSEFPIRIWVDIPHDLCSSDLLHMLCLNILKEFIKQGMVGYNKLATWLDIPRDGESRSSQVSFLDILDYYIERDRIDDIQLIRAVHGCLEEKRLLLVMDDILTADTLESIRCCLPNTGKVLITSRRNRVTPNNHVLRFMNEEECWELLQLEVFGEGGRCPSILKSTGECIAKNCDGSPLVISVIASSLMVPSSTDDEANALTKTCWKKVSENVTAYITEYGAQHKVSERLESSYVNLPQYLQSCFLYVGVFPEGDEIPVWTLFRLWIAEGLVQDSCGLTLDETAERNMYDLVNRNLVMVGKIYPNGQIKTCRLHKLLYGFCKRKAAEQEFYHDIKRSTGGALDGPVSLTPNHRRLCINSSCLSQFLSSWPNGRFIRSILCLNKGDKALKHEHIFRIIISFKLLNIFECKGVKLYKIPRDLCDLEKLKYISLSCDFGDIPETISRLRYLETLVVETQSPSIKLRANIWRMFQLQHLVTKAAIVLAIREKGEAGQNLQTLTRLAPACCTEDVFTRAPNLKTLGIRGPLAALSSADSLRKLEFLENLKMINEPAVAAESQLHLDCFPPNLKRLTLSGTYLRWESMSILGEIESLEILKLKNNAFVGVSWTSTDADGFRSLVFLSIATTQLISWKASEECFPSLKCLVLDKCEDLNEIPLTLAKSLDTLDVEKVGSESAVASARLIEQEIARRQGQNKK